MTCMKDDAKVKTLRLIIACYTIQCNDKKK